jgi:hypothetical protein
MFSLINYDELSEDQVSITEEQRRFEPIKTQLGISYHMTYVGPRPTYINLFKDPPKQDRVRATRQHSTPSPYCQPRCFRPSQIRRVGTRYSRHLSTPSARLSVLIME